MITSSKIERCQAFEHQFVEHVCSNGLWSATDQLLVACSGGVDSVVLVHLLKKAGYPFMILHCNFNLRGEESMRDELFVRQLASSLGVDLEVKSFDTKTAMETMGKGTQETARILRYSWFSEMVEQKHQPNKKTYLLTAHHGDDLAETMAMNFFRGTGIAGLHGIPERSGTAIRPLLFARRSEILDYATGSTIQWVDDSSNLDDHYTRNLFRNIIFPEVQKVFPAATVNLMESAKRFTEIELLYRQRINELKAKLVQSIDGNICIAVNKLTQVDAIDTVMHEIFKEFGFGASQIPEIKKLFTASSGKYTQSSTHRVLRNRAWLLIDPLTVEDNAIVLVEAGVSEVPVNGFLLSFSAVNSLVNPDHDPGHAFVDARFIQYPLIVRKWKNGDYFYPLGMKKKKKVARFLTDLKLSKIEKENQWVIESNKKIIWVIGRRIDDRVKLTESSKSVLILNLKPKS